MPSLRDVLVDIEPIKRDRDFRMVWIGQLVNGLGRNVTVVALPLELWNLTHNSVSIGVLAIVQLVPILFFSLGGGAIADAVDRRRLLMVTQVLLAIASLAFVALALQPDPPVAAFYLVAFAAAGVSAVDGPARSSAIPRLVPRERLPAAIAVNWLSGSIVAVAGPAFAGLLVAVSGGAAAAFAFDVVTYLGSLAALLVIAPIPPHPEARASLRSIQEGLHFAYQRRVILSTFAIDFNAMLFGMPSALFPQLAFTVFNVGSSGLGLMYAAPSLGAFLGAALSGWIGKLELPGRGVIVAVALWGVSIAAFGLCTFSFALALAFLTLAGLADLVSAVLRGAIVQLATPDRLRGRVTSIHMLVVTSGPRLGDAEAAGVAAIAGPQFSVASGGLACVLGVFVVLGLFPQLATYRHAPEQMIDAELPTPAGAEQI